MKLFLTNSIDEIKANALMEEIETFLEEKAM